MTTSAIYWIADRLAPQLKRQFLASVLSLRGRITINKLTIAIAQGGHTTAIDSAFQLFAKDLQPVTGTLANIFEQSAQLAEKQVVKRLGVTGAFDIVNPLAVEAAKERGSLLVREITQKTRRGLQDVISRAITDGIPPRTAATQIRQLVGLTSRQSLAVWNFRQSLEESGASSLHADRATQRYAAKLHRQRALNIARTETVRASNEGQQAAWDGARTQGLLSGDAKKKWIAAESERTCPICVRLDKHKPVLVVDSFKDSTGKSIKHPPAHPQCRCTVGLVFPKRRRR
jgi:hypothetical protein